MRITVAICTWNRAEQLDATLAGLHALRVPAGLAWDVLVVNNACSDDTDAVIGRHAGTLPLRRAFEPTPGHSNARNRAVGEATGDLVLWTDDDVRVSRDWLAEHATAAEKYPDAAFFGGPIVPELAPGAPADLNDHMAAVGAAFAARDYGPAVRSMSYPVEQPFGANLMLRMSALKGRRFHPQLGRIGAGMVGGDETILLNEVVAAGGTGVWVGTAPVAHLIPPDRSDWGYVWRYFVGQGETAIRLDGLPAAATVLGRPRWLLAAYPLARLRSWLNRQAGHSAWVAHYTLAARYAGFLREVEAFRRTGWPPPAGLLVPPLARRTP